MIPLLLTLALPCTALWPPRGAIYHIPYIQSGGPPFQITANRTGTWCLRKEEQTFDPKTHELKPLLSRFACPEETEDAQWARGSGFSPKRCLECESRRPTPFPTTEQPTTPAPPTSPPPTIPTMASTSSEPSGKDIGFGFKTRPKSTPSLRTTTEPTTTDGPVEGDDTTDSTEEPEEPPVSPGIIWGSLGAALFSLFVMVPAAVLPYRRANMADQIGDVEMAPDPNEREFLVAEVDTDAYA